MDGFEATRSFTLEEVDGQGKDVPASALPGDGTLQLILDVCAPLGYYDLDIDVRGDSIDSLDSVLDIPWKIDAPSNEVTTNRLD